MNEEFVNEEFVNRAFVGKTCLFAADALLPTGWARDVLLGWDDAGQLTQVRTGAQAPAGVPRVAGPLLPGMPNLHSHAFQRAMAGLTEFQGAAGDAGPDRHDSFWSWRTLMYRFAARLTPEQFEAIALGLSATHGAIAVGMPANFVLWNVDEAAELAYWFGQRPVRTVVRQGRIAVGAGS